MPIWFVIMVDFACSYSLMFRLRLLVCLFVGFAVFSDRCIAVQLGDVTLKMIDGSVIEGTIDAIDEQGRLSGQNVPDDCSMDQVASVLTGRAVVGQKAPVEIRLVSAGVVFADQVTISDDKVQVRRQGNNREISLDLVEAIIWNNSETAAAQMQDRSSESDAVVVATDSGERVVQGILEGVDSTHVKIRYRGESRKIGISKVNAVVVADLKLPSADGSKLTVSLIDGSKFVGVFKALADTSLVLSPIASSSVSLAVAEIVSIEVQSDRVVYLSDLEPVDVQQRSVFSVPRPWKRDKSIEGSPLTLVDRSTGKNNVYSKGLGTQANTSLTFENEGDFDRLEATVGIDAETMGRGDCELIVRGDGIKLWSKRMRGSDGPEVLSVDISGMKQIVLSVRSGEQFDLADHIDWCDARFMKNQ